MKWNFLLIWCCCSAAANRLIRSCSFAFNSAVTERISRPGCVCVASSKHLNWVRVIWSIDGIVAAGVVPVASSHHNAHLMRMRSLRSRPTWQFACHLQVSSSILGWHSTVVLSLPIPIPLPLSLSLSLSLPVLVVCFIFVYMAIATLIYLIRFIIVFTRALK